MPSYKIFRMKENERQRFRWAPHSSGATMVKPRDFDECETVEAATLYTAWNQLKNSDTPLQVGDILAAPDDTMQILKYIGFEEARWVLPEAKPVPLPFEEPQAAAASV